MQTEFLPSTGQMFPDLETCESVTANGPTPTGRDWKDGTAKSCQNVPVNSLLGRAIHSPTLTLSVVASHASPIHLPENARLLRTTATCGESLSESFAKLDPDGFWRKTCQGCSPQKMDGSLEGFSGTWPKAGMMRSGTAYRRRSLGRRTYGSESSLWPTPSASSERPNEGNVRLLRAKVLAGEITEAEASSMLNGKSPMEVQGKVRQWPTPRGTDGEHGGRVTSRKARNGGNLIEAVSAVSFPTPTANRRDGLRSHGVNVVTGTLNPTWVEWLMGFPRGWTDLDASETQ